MVFYWVGVWFDFVDYCYILGYLVAFLVRMGYYYLMYYFYFCRLMVDIKVFLVRIFRCVFGGFLNRIC